MDVLVELDAAEGFRYAVTAAGGSEMLQEKILRKVLGVEQEVYASRTNERTALTAANSRGRWRRVPASGSRASIWSSGTRGSGGTA